VLEQLGLWAALGVFDLKEHFTVIGMATLPAYWYFWRQPLADQHARTRAALTALLASSSGGISWSATYSTTYGGSGHDGAALLSCLRNRVCGRVRSRVRDRGFEKLRVVYLPSRDQRVRPGRREPKDGVPAMYWYGWIATSTIAASVAGFVACYLPQRLTQRLWSGLSWVAPLCAIPVFCYLLRTTFCADVDCVRHR